MIEYLSNGKKKVAKEEMWTECLQKQCGKNEKSQPGMLISSIIKRYRAFI